MPLDLMRHASFGKLRLSPFLPGVRVVPPSRDDPGAGRRLRGDVIVLVDDWELDERKWVGEVIGFTEVLRLARAPEVTRSVAVELVGKRRAVGHAILAAIGLPLAARLGRADVEERLGKPKEVLRLVRDRETLELTVGSRDAAYRVSCTVEHARGLSYVVVRVPRRPRR